ncbi:MAG: hypothetical protein M3O46_05010 [Myxococcota bacterium]|nr:hypothetical protein [Myxococcota bacterium]
MTGGRALAVSSSGREGSCGRCVSRRWLKDTGGAAGRALLEPGDRELGAKTGDAAVAASGDVGETPPSGAQDATRGASL